MSQVIALVDDDRNILTSVSIALQQEGFVTRVYSDPALALRAGIILPPVGAFNQNHDSPRWEFVDRPLASANAVLHSVHCEHLKALLERRPDQVTMAMRVRQLLAHELSLGRPTAHGVAKQMNISRRTVSAAAS